jgi:hypothetical protein
MGNSHGTRVISGGHLARPRHTWTGKARTGGMRGAALRRGVAQQQQAARQQQAAMSLLGRLASALGTHRTAPPARSGSK